MLNTTLATAMTRALGIAFALWLYPVAAAFVLVALPCFAAYAAWRQARLAWLWLREAVRV